jgi:hypothetical protein
MPGRTSATRSLNKPVHQLAPRSPPRTSDPAGVPDTLAKLSGKLSDTGNQRLRAGPMLTASASTSTPRSRTAAPGLTVGIFLYLVSVGLIATVIIGVFFGIGFFLLAHPTEKMIAGPGTHDRGTEVKPVPSGVFLHPYRDAPPVLVEAELPRSVATAALPVAPLAQDRACARGPTAGEQCSNAEFRAGVPPGEVPVSGTTGTPATGEARLTPPAQTGPR